MGPHCDLDLEDSTALCLYDTPADGVCHQTKSHYKRFNSLVNIAQASINWKFEPLPLASQYFHKTLYSSIWHFIIKLSLVAKGAVAQKT